jgi:tetratricopeptide (TPR) repeat protein
MKDRSVAKAAAFAARAVLESLNAVASLDADRLRDSLRAREREDVDASRVVARAAGLPPEQVEASAMDNPRWHTLAVADHLMAYLVEHHHVMTPRQALAFANAAVTACVAARTTSPSHLCRAWKEVAVCQMDMGQFTHAYTALRNAFDHAERTAAARYHRALVQFAKAAILDAQERYVEALTELDAAIEAFEAEGDTRKSAAAGAYRLRVLYSQGRYFEALAGHNDLCDDAAAAGDDPATALQLGNIGHCLMKLGCEEEARDHFSVAASLYDIFGMKVPMARMLRALALAAIRSEGCDGPTVSDVCGRFEQLGMPHEIVYTKLDAVETMLAKDEDVEELCCSAMCDAVRLGMSASAVVALETLRRSANRHTVTPQFVRDIAHSVKAANGFGSGGEVELPN